MIGRLRTPQIWRLGRHVVSLAGGTLHRRADLSAEAVVDTGLRLDADSRLRRHVNIVGWPDHKAKQKSHAQKLARASTALLVQVGSTYPEGV